MTTKSLLAQVAAKVGPEKLYRLMTPEQRLFARYSYEANARPMGRLPTGEYTGQMEPPGDWRVWLLLPGRNWGKTWTLNQWIRRRAKKYPGCRIGVVGATTAEVRKTVGQGESGLLNICPPWEKPHWNVTDQCYEFPNGSNAFLITAEKPDTMRGPQFHFLALDEFAKFRRIMEVWYNAQFCLRLPVRGGRAQMMITTTPRPLQILRDIRIKDTTAVTVGSSFENAAHTDPSTVKEWLAWKDTQIGRQELMGELFDEQAGAIFSRKWYKYIADEKLPQMDRIGVGFDPAETSRKESDDSGIIVAGRSGVGIAARAYILDDRTGHGTPDAMARRAVETYRDWGASFMKIDCGRGGEAFIALVRMAAQQLNVSVNVLAGKGGNLGKRAWSEPIKGVYEQGRIFHTTRTLDESDIPVLRALEEQQCTWTEECETGPERWSPDRMDAANYVLTELMLQGQIVQAGLNSTPAGGRRM
jgi:phage terminase large subunit-like protein